MEQMAKTLVSKINSMNNIVMYNGDEASLKLQENCSHFPLVGNTQGDVLLTKKILLKTYKNTTGSFNHELCLNVGFKEKDLEGKSKKDLALCYSLNIFSVFIKVMYCTYN